MKNGRIVALSAISTALALVFIIIGAYIPTFDLSCLFMASLCIMLPLTKNSLKGAFLTYLAVFLLSLIFSAGRFTVSICFALFFGLHPIVNYLQNKINNKFRILFYALKFIWFIISVYVMYYFLTMFIIEYPLIEKYIHFILLGVSLVFFPIYDILAFRFQRTFNVLIRRLKI